jgi:hypothetical protein
MCTTDVKKLPEIPFSGGGEEKVTTHITFEIKFVFLLKHRVFCNSVTEPAFIKLVFKAPEFALLLLRVWTYKIFYPKMGTLCFSTS